jgi:hypothetical protein
VEYYFFSLFGAGAGHDRAGHGCVNEVETGVVFHLSFFGDRKEGRVCFCRCVRVCVRASERAKGQLG